MKLINVRKGQFVYFENKLHKVYGVKPFFRKSVHLIRLHDFEQRLATAKEIDYYKPQHLDSFIYHHRRYTLNQHVQAKVGDYILVINPRPDSLDHHHLNAIEMVSSLEKNGVISNKSNGIKHNEYWVMVPGLEKGANVIDLQDQSSLTAEQMEENTDAPIEETTINTPRIGAIYQKNDSDPILQTMVLAIAGRTVHLGGGLQVTIDELSDANKWSYVIHADEHESSI